jgi:hypothetical protein
MAWLSFAVSIGVYMAAARRRPSSDPVAPDGDAPQRPLCGRCWSGQIRPSFRKARVKASQRFSM